MSITGKKVLLQPAPARSALTDSNPKAVSAAAAKGPAKPKPSGSSTAPTERDKVLQECRRKLVGKRVALLKLLNAADVTSPPPPPVHSPPTSS